MPTSLLSESYSAISQRDLLTMPRAAVIAELRADLLFAPQVVLPDTHLFDGAFFLRENPDTLLSDLGAPTHLPPIHIKLRGSNFDESLTRFSIQTDATGLAPLSFHIIDDEGLREAVRQRLRATPPSEIFGVMVHASDAVNAFHTFVGGLISKVGGDPGVISYACDGLRRWRDALVNGRVTADGWLSPMNLAGAMALDPLFPGTDIVETRTILLYDYILRTAASGVSGRSAILDPITWLRADATPAEAVELAAIDQWYLDCRHRALAIQHDCTLVRPLFLDSVLQRRLTLAKGIALGSRGLALGDLITPFDRLWVALQRIDGRQFAGLRIEAERSLASWWYDDDLESLKVAVNLVLEQLVPPPAEVELIRVISGAIGAAIGAKLGGPLGAATSAAISFGSATLVNHLAAGARLGQVVEILSRRAPFQPPSQPRPGESLAR